MSRYSAYVQPMVIDARSADAKRQRVHGVRRDINGNIMSGVDQQSGIRLNRNVPLADPLVPAMGAQMGWLKRMANVPAPVTNAAVTPAIPVSTPSRASMLTARSGQATPVAAPVMAPAAVQPNSYQMAVGRVSAAPTASNNTMVSPLPNGGYRTAAKPDYKNNVADGMTPYGLVGRAAEVANRATAGVAQRAADKTRREEIATSMGATDVTGMDSGQAQAAVGGGYKAAVAGGVSPAAPAMDAEEEDRKRLARY